MAAIVALSAGLIGACGDDDDDPTVADSDATTTVVTDASGTATLKFVAADFEFDKETVTAADGQALTIELQNNGAVTHNLTIENLNVDMDAVTGATETQTPVTPAAGVYEYFCKFHKANMKGELTVS